MYKARFFPLVVYIFPLSARKGRQRAFKGKNVVPRGKSYKVKATQIVSQIIIIPERVALHCPIIQVPYSYAIIPNSIALALGSPGQL